MQTKLIERLRERLGKVGATLDANDYTLNCDAPPGYVWAANGETNLAIHYATNSETWLVQALREEESNLRMGLRLATAEELPYIRHGLDEDTWGAPTGAPEELNV